MSHQLYVAESSGGIVKVGRTSFAGKVKTSELRSKFRRMFGHELVRVQFAPPMHTFCNYCRAEMLLIKQAAATGGQRVRGREWFVGVDFEKAVDAACVITHTAIAEGEEYALQRDIHNLQRALKNEKRRAALRRKK